MNLYTEKLHRKNKTFNRVNLDSNLKSGAILIFTIGFSTMNTLFYNSVEIMLGILVASVSLLILNTISNQKLIYYTKNDFIWQIFISIFTLNILMKAVVIGISNIELVDLCIYLICIIFLVLTKADIYQYKNALYFIKFLGVFYAVSASLQYFFTDFYIRIFLPFFRSDEQAAILHLMNSNSYSGFTNQTAHLAGYIVNGLGVAIFSYKLNKKLPNKVFSILMILLMLFGLILAAKRAHMIFIIIALIVTYLCSSKQKEALIRVLKTIASIFLIGFFLFISMITFGINENTPLGIFLKQITETLVGLMAGNDVTNGRSILYGHSWDLFTDNPILGIGWREFSNNSVGLISDGISHPHNIYLQILSELGIIGLILFLLPLGYTYLKTIKVLNYVSKGFEEINNIKWWILGLQFSLYSQSFFILYGMTGNLLTDYNFLLMYFLATSITISASIFLKK